MAGKVSKLGGRSEGNDSDPASKMCEPCRDKFRTLSEAQRPCDRPGCASTWTWSVQAQLEAFATRRSPPPHLCAEDEAKLSALVDRQIPCSVAGCKRHWVLSRRAQLIAGAPDVEVVPPPAMCGPCANVYDKISDRPVTCGIRGCKKKWTWGRDEQIQDYAAGESNEPPRRLCESCKGVFGAIAHREVRCRTSGCKNTWTWPREMQLDAAIADKPLPKAPHRMCQRCIDLYSSLRDVERPCRRPGCKHTWTDKRGAQLARAVRGKVGDPYPHYCAECEKEMGELEEQHVPCKTEHCPGTWTWTAAQQLAAGVRPTPKAEADGPGAPQVQRAPQSEVRNGATSDRRQATLVAGGEHAPQDQDQDHNHDHEHDVVPGDSAQPGDGEVALASPDAGEATAGNGGLAANGGSQASPAPGGAGDRKRRRRKRRREVRPPGRRCDDCLAFLTDRKTKEIPCTGCQTPIHWPPESQLQTHLGNWAEPSLCGACKRDLTEAARVAEREALRHGGHLHEAHLHEGHQTAATPPEAATGTGDGVAVAQPNTDSGPESTPGPPSEVSDSPNAATPAHVVPEDAASPNTDART
ncbi:MAG: hypothetical protein ABJA82_05545 [Myxococcales bacterium]